MGASCRKCVREDYEEIDAPLGAVATSLEAVLEKLKAGDRDAALDDQVGIQVEERLRLRSGSLSYLIKRREPQPKAEGETHQVWKNQLANQVVQPLQVCKPTTLGEVGAILADAVRNSVKVKAAGSGHSYSDVATTTDYFVDTHDLRGVESDTDPITGQLQQKDLKADFRADNMKAKWRPINDLPDITDDSQLEDILHVRDVFENNTMLFETEAGITIKQLNNELEEAGLALPNMGGYDGQTIVGAISTSTHGTGIGLPPFPDMMRSLVLATTGTWDGQVISGAFPGPVNYYRIEPSSRAITDPEQYKQAQSQAGGLMYYCDGKPIQLIQDDDCFRAVMVNMGTMGVMFSVVLEAMQFYYLTETRTTSTLDKSLALIQPDANDPDGVPAVMRRYRHFEILVSPYPMDGLKVIDMDPSKPPETYYPNFETLHFHMNITPRYMLPFGPNTKPRNFIASVLGKLDISFEVLAYLANTFNVAPLLVKSGIAALEDENFVAKSYQIYNLGVNGDAGFANEIGFPVQNSASTFTPEHLTAAINNIHRTAQTARLQGDQYQTSPFAVRFVKQSPAFLSMMNGVDTAMIELDMVTGSYGGTEILNRQQRGLYELGGRPHWGLEFDQLTGSHGLVAGMYPDYARWKLVYDQLNSKGTFDNSATIRLGFSELNFRR